MTDNTDWISQAAVQTAPAHPGAAFLAAGLGINSYGVNKILIAGVVGSRMRLFSILIHPPSQASVIYLIPFTLVIAMGPGTTLQQTVFNGNTNPDLTIPVAFPLGLDSLNTGDNLIAVASERFTVGGTGIGGASKASPVIDVYWTQV